MADSLTHVSAHARLRSQGTPSFLLGKRDRRRKGISLFLPREQPRKVFKVYENETEIWGKNRRRIQGSNDSADPLDLIEEEMAQYNLLKSSDLPPFIGGAVGGIAYEYIHRVETTVPRAEGPGLGTPALLHDHRFGGCF